MHYFECKRNEFGGILICEHSYTYVMPLNTATIKHWRAKFSANIPLKESLSNNEICINIVLTIVANCSSRVVPTVNGTNLKLNQCTFYLRPILVSESVG